MADQKVTDHALIKLENQLSHRFDSVKGQLKTLQATIDSLEGHWKGIGANAFNVKQDEVNKRMVKIANLLMNYMEAIKAARTIAGNTDDEIRQALQGVDVVSGYSGDTGAEAKMSNLNNF